MNEQYKGFLPISQRELEIGEQLDFICVTGDAYVDHPSFGIAIVSRLLQSRGFSVGIIAQPVSDSAFSEFGEPRYAFMVSGGNIDSMVANYTVSGKKRHKDDYSAGGVGGKRPDYAVKTYCKTIKRLFPNVGIIIGGLEASLRRFAHYDFWSDKVLPSLLISSGADLLIYGMAELTLVQLCDKLHNGDSLRNITDLLGTCYTASPDKMIELQGREAKENFKGIRQCDSFELVSTNKTCYAKSAVIQHEEQDEVSGRMIVQRHGEVMLVQNPPQRSLAESELSQIYELPFMRKPHPIYKPVGGVPAIREVEFSLTWNRGCFGGCNFCSIALHQGQKVQSRSESSVLAEAEKFLENRDFKGYIHDVGGPTANFSSSACKKQSQQGACKRKCLVPTPCPNLKITHEKYLQLLRKLRKIDGVKKVFIRSGIRYDYLLADQSKAGREFFRELVVEHTSGQLKVAPEHCKSGVLDMMGKPKISVFEKFCNEFNTITKRAGKEQYLVPYLMSSHPGATLDDALDLAVWLKKRKIRPEQVQDFYPTPGTISTAMYYTGLNPYTLEKIYVAKSQQQRATQRALLQYYKHENRALFEKLLAQREKRNSSNNNKRGKINANKFKQSSPKNNSSQNQNAQKFKKTRKKK
ncbi:MAG: YgiQ family radical SAM protein [Oscillospiraceae bacterium]|nr:YgiQ family radical SAM protein [Oscillospiraceae bacterium]